MSGPSEIIAFVNLRFSKRCKSKSTITSICKFINEYYNFAMSIGLGAPIAGEHAIVPIARWIAALALRGPSAPRMGRYALRVFSEALGINFPIDHPAVAAAARTNRTKPTKQAPMVPTEFIKDLEYATVNGEYPYLKRLFCALFLLQVYASLRFADTKKVSHIFASKTALCGVSVDPKSRNHDITQWAAPLKGLTGEKWWLIISKYREGVKPTEEGEFSTLYPRVNRDWETKAEKIATIGSARTTLTRIEKEFGFHVVYEYIRRDHGTLR